MLRGGHDEENSGCKEDLLRVQSVYGKVVLRRCNGDLSAVWKRSGESDTGHTAVVERTFHARTPIGKSPDACR